MNYVSDNSSLYSFTSFVKSRNLLKYWKWLTADRVTNKLFAAGPGILKWLLSCSKLFQIKRALSRQNIKIIPWINCSNTDLGKTIRPFDEMPNTYSEHKAADVLEQKIYKAQKISPNVSAHFRVGVCNMIDRKHEKFKAKVSLRKHRITGNFCGFLFVSPTSHCSDHISVFWWIQRMQRKLLICINRENHLEFAAAHHKTRLAAQTKVLPLLCEYYNTIKQSQYSVQYCQQGLGTFSMLISGRYLTVEVSLSAITFGKQLQRNSISQARCSRRSMVERNSAKPFMKNKKKMIFPCTHEDVLHKISGLVYTKLTARILLTQKYKCSFKVCAARVKINREQHRRQRLFAQFVSQFSVAWEASHYQPLTYCEYFKAETLYSAAR